MSSLFQRIAEVEASGTPAALVTVVRTQGSTPRSSGARMLVFADGRSEGTIGGGTVEHKAIAKAVEVIESGTTEHFELKLGQDLGMCCGGTMLLLIEPLSKKPVLVIFGAGHVGSALARVALMADFDVHVADDREEIVDRADLPSGASVYADVQDPKIPLGPETFVMITTHDHSLDQRLAERALKGPFRWIGVIGSKRKAEMTKKRLLHKGFEPEVVAKLRSPVGLSIGAETAEEIAISILGELIAVRRGAAVADAIQTELETKAG